MLISIFCIYIAIKLNTPWYVTLLPYLHIVLGFVDYKLTKDRQEVVTEAVLRSMGLWEDKDNE